jgi:hypothetical protein
VVALDVRIAALTTATRSASSVVTALNTEDGRNLGWLAAAQQECQALVARLAARARVQVLGISPRLRGL